MKSKTSFFNKTIFLKNITHFWPIWLMILAWNVFIMPFMIYNSSLQYKMMNTISEKELAILRSNDILSIVYVYINPVILFIFSVIAVMAVFSYLYNARSANAIHALPVTRKELFITNYFSGLLFLVVPEIIGFLMGTLVSAMCGYTSMNHLLTGLLFAIGLSVIFYSFTVFVAMFTGQLLAVPIFTVILQFLFVGSRAIVTLLMSMLSYGMPLDLNGSKTDILSPLYYIVRHVKLWYDYTEEYGRICMGLSGKWIVGGYMLAAVVFVIAAYLIYRIRNMETAGSLVSISWICPLFRWGAAFCGGALFSVIFCGVTGFSSGKGIFISVLLFALFFGSIFFFGAQMFLEKGFRVFKKKRLIECGIFLVIFGSMYVAIETDLFGQEKKVPDLSQIQTAYIDNCDVSDEDLIEQVLEIHRQIIDSKKEFEAFAETSQETYYIPLVYTMKKGSSFRRSYEIPITEETLSDQTSVAHKIAELSSIPKVYKKQLFRGEDDEIEPRQCWIDLYDENDEAENYEFSAEDTKKMYQAVLADIEEGNFKEYILNKYSYDNSAESVYFNTIAFEYIRREKDEKGQHAENVSEETMISFDVNCRNIIGALIETGAIKSKADLVTLQERDEWDENMLED